MDFERILPLRLWLNFETSEDRRVEMEARLEEAEISAERFPATGAPTASNFREGDPEKSERAYNLTFRLALREAKRRKAPAVLLIADDVGFHPNFSRLISNVSLPGDWGIILLGCTHLEEPQLVSTRLVRVSQMLHPQAVAIKAEFFEVLMKALRRSRTAGLPLSSTIGSVTSEIPVFAVYPNLAWQIQPPTAGPDTARAAYTSDGKQTLSIEAVKRLLPQMVGSGLQEPKLGLLFLTREDVNQPQIWREFIEEAPDRVRIFSHVKYPERVKGRILRGTMIRKRFDTAWGGISLVQASRALLNEALEDQTLTHFILLSESCIPIRPLPEILRKLHLDPRPQFQYWPLKIAPDRQLNRSLSAPSIPDECWRFSSQWWLFDRAAATFSAGVDYSELFRSVDIPDESYFGTVLAMQGYPLHGEVNNVAVTWTHWEDGAGSPTPWGNLPDELFVNMLNSGSLFARKFDKMSTIGEKGLHRSPSRAS